MEDKTGSGYKERKTKKFNARIVADNIMKGVIVLIMVVIFVMIADQLIGTPFISAEIEGEFFHGSIFGTTIMAVMTYIVGIILGALVATVFRRLRCASFGRPFIVLNWDSMILKARISSSGR